MLTSLRKKIISEIFRLLFYQRLPSFSGPLSARPPHRLGFSLAQLLLSDRNFIRSFQEVNRFLYIRFVTQVQTDPPGLGQNVMRFRKPSVHDFIAYLFWKWNIHKGIAVYMSEFACTKAIFHTTEAMRRRGNTIPRGQNLGNHFLGTGNRHIFIYRKDRLSRLFLTT